MQIVRIAGKFHSVLALIEIHLAEYFRVQFPTLPDIIIDIFPKLRLDIARHY